MNITAGGSFIFVVFVAIILLNLNEIKNCQEIKRGWFTAILFCLGTISLFIRFVHGYLIIDTRLALSILCRVD